MKDSEFVRNYAQDYNLDPDELTRIADKIAKLENLSLRQAQKSIMRQSVSNWLRFNDGNIWDEAFRL